MTADRVPQPGEVWVFRHLAQLGRGHVLIESVDDDRVHYVYRGTGTDAPLVELRHFVTLYDHLADTLDAAPQMLAPSSAGPQRMMPGTAVS